jgi:hypothetical protein
MVFAAGDDDGKPELQSQELEKKPQDQIYIEFPQGLKTFLTFLKKWSGHGVLLREPSQR